MPPATRTPLTAGPTIRPRPVAPPMMAMPPARSDGLVISAINAWAPDGTADRKAPTKARDAVSARKMAVTDMAPERPPTTTNV